MQIRRFILLATMGAAIGIVPCKNVHADQHPQCYALLIAVTGYSHGELNRPQLQYPEIDAKAVGEFLSKHGYKVDYLLGPGATKANISARLDGLERHGNPSGAVFVGLWGHGSEDEGSREGMFCPYDTRPRAVKDSQGNSRYDRNGEAMVKPNPTSLVGMQQLLLALKQSRAGCRVLLADCCRMSPNPARGRAFGSSVTTADLPDNTAAIFACRADEQAFEDERWGHGALTRCFLDLLPTILENESINVSRFGPQLQRDVRQLVTTRTNGRDSQTVVLLEKGVAKLKLQTPVLPQAFTNSIGMQLKLIPSGSFLMGSPDSESNRRDDEGPQRRVTISKPFYAGIHEVTIADILAWLNSYRIAFDETWIDHNEKDFPIHYVGGGRFERRSSMKFSASARQPMIKISWHGAAAFCNWLSQKEGRRYRLPTEAEWEYMARAGTTLPYWWGTSENGNMANCNGNFPCGTEKTGPYQKVTKPVGSYQANAFGLFDTSGNVCEWCSDWYDKDAYASLPAVDPQGPASGEPRVLRGGSWINSAHVVRSARRYYGSPEYRINDIGFRVVCEPE